MPLMDLAAGNIVYYIMESIFSSLVPFCFRAPVDYKFPSDFHVYTVACSPMLGNDHERSSYTIAVAK
jgi:hypothetical protein